jgi:DNA-binding MarR family transcriptional regulator
MSIIHETPVWPLEMPGLKKLVLLAIYRNADMRTLEGFALARQLARACGQSESAVRKSVAELEQEGYFVRMRVPGRGIKYCINLDWVKP